MGQPPWVPVFQQLDSICLELSNLEVDITMLQPGNKGAIAQMYGTVESTMLPKIDGISTENLDSMRDCARAKRKTLVARAERLLDRLEHMAQGKENGDEEEGENNALDLSLDVGIQPVLADASPQEWNGHVPRATETNTEHNPPGRQDDRFFTESNSTSQPPSSLYPPRPELPLPSTATPADGHYTEGTNRGSSAVPLPPDGTGQAESSYSPDSPPPKTSDDIPPTLADSTVSEEHRRRNTEGGGGREVPLGADAANKLGNEAYRNGQLADAVAHYSQAIDQDSAQSRYHSNRSVAFFKLGDYSAAVADADRAIELHPTWHKGHLRKAAALLRLSQFPSAMDSYHHALQCGEVPAEVVMEIERALTHAARQQSNTDSAESIKRLVDQLCGSITGKLDDYDLSLSCDGERWQLEEHQKYATTCGRGGGGGSGGNGGFPEWLQSFALVPTTVTPLVYQNAAMYSITYTGELAGLQSFGLDTFGQIAPPFDDVRQTGFADLPGVRGATTCCWLNPIPSVRQLEERNPQPAEPNTAVQLLSCGGFAFMDSAGRVLRTFAIGGGADVTFGPPLRWKSECTQRLAAASRFQPIISPRMRQEGARWFAWLNPMETLLTTNGAAWLPPIPHGGFAYLFHEDPHDSSPLDCFFPIADICGGTVRTPLPLHLTSPLTCLGCKEQTAHCVLHPCLHCCLCAFCASRLRFCPIDRRRIESAVNMFA
eukprot:NODE_123_length_2332_cov_324.037232_g100_i0.p1 GENE.NODE_123_length_2332_cov_324.037232_g100_i0~~NODE_123_length_2332_cov_324.037232_g100_i0.p1  ORF type:complete len:714 (-),score=127.48 NODE_123_length_2332_cov_324.037232_g100_i0:107-2248(-)